MNRLTRGALLGLLLLNGALYADDKDANEKYAEGLQSLEAKDYTGAADDFLAAELLADSVPLKANAVSKAIEAYRQAGMYYKEFENIEKMLDSYAAQCDYAALVDREYQIGDAFYEGHRDPAFYSLRFIPWLSDSDKTEEVYTKALERAPYTPQGPETQLRLAVRLIEGRKLNEAAEMLRQILKRYPEAPERKYAYLRLGTVLYELALSGDGDGRYSAEAQEVLREFQKRYPEATENPGVAKLILKIRDAEAQRLKEIAEFYHRMGRDAVAERYLNQILKELPDSAAADSSEELLTEIDRSYVPETVVKDQAERLDEFAAYPIPAEPHELLLVPENSDGRFLLPIYDLNLQNNSGPAAEAAVTEPAEDTNK
ncbi:outer membrane protein assembly factor BamD [Victivallis sp. Marseille-Q1083]|uniref:outer membrane protein assembly factor BamD n=1 Tax=Victivallis sp. Marseille-Q1083 TaxID=2717288 RepID=UPI001588A3A9|nr:outer membrane protein assembly factor BamD [Victivallis sp. Marseille-Q1083]